MATKQLTIMAPEVVKALDRGVAIWRTGRLSEAEVQFQTALEQALRQNCLSGILSARHLLGSLAYVSGALHDAYEHHHAVLEQCQSAGITLGVASSLQNLGLITALRGDPAAGVRLINRAISLYEALGETTSAAVARANRSALIAGRVTNSSITNAAL